MILLCGDPHGEFNHIIQRVQQSRPAAVIILGDLSLSLPFEQTFAGIWDMTQLWYIHGNHDTDQVRYYDNLFACPERNLHGHVVEIDGLKVAGLGGIFRGQVWYPPEPPLYHTRADFLAHCGKGNLWRNGIPLRHRSTIFPEDIQGLQGQQADILVSHEAPSAHPHGFQAIDELANALGAKTILHGHHHNAFSYSEPSRVNVGFRELITISSGVKGSR